MPVTNQIIGVESGGNPRAKNPRSSATGLGQFISSTWLEEMRKRKPQMIKGKTRQQILDMRLDPNLSREMTGHYEKDTNDFLRSRGFKVTPGNTYLGHFAGRGGAARILSSNPNTPIRNIMGAAAMRANPFLKGRTTGWVQNWASRKMGGPQQQGKTTMKPAFKKGIGRGGIARLPLGQSQNAFVQGHLGAGQRPARGPRLPQNTSGTFHGMFGGGQSAQLPPPPQSNIDLDAELADNGDPQGYSPEQMALFKSNADDAPNYAPQNIGQGLTFLGHSIRNAMSQNKYQDAMQKNEAARQGAMGQYIQSQNVGPGIAAMMRNPQTQQVGMALLGRQQQQQRADQVYQRNRADALTDQQRGFDRQDSVYERSQAANLESQQRVFKQQEMMVRLKAELVKPQDELTKRKLQLGIQVLEKKLNQKGFSEYEKSRQRKLGEMAAEEVKQSISNEKSARQLSAGLENLASQPNQFSDGDFERGVGPFQGGNDEGLLGAPLRGAAKLVGEVDHFLRGKKSPTEVRRAIDGAVATLSALVKPIIRTPGEGVFSDGDQKQLDTVIGSLSTVRTKTEYARAMSGVIRRVRALAGEKGIKLRPETISSLKRLLRGDVETRGKVPIKPEKSNKSNFSRGGVVTTGEFSSGEDFKEAHDYLRDRTGVDLRSDAPKKRRKYNPQTGELE